MKMNGNTILITGGASGIGLGLAEEFKKLGNEVIVAGRSQNKLELASSKGLKTFTVDMTDKKSIENLAANVIKEFPRLNVVIHNAGIMKAENIAQGNHKGIAQETVETNLLGPIYLNDALLPHLLKQTDATIMTVSSGLAFAPLAMTPTYCATKAAIHSYSQSLRYQLKSTNVKVLELAPPYVQTQLMGEFQAQDPMAMPLKDFISEVIQILSSGKHANNEVLVERVMSQRNSANGGPDAHEAYFTKYNDMMSEAFKV